MPGMVIDSTTKMIYSMAEPSDLNSWLKTLEQIRVLPDAKVTHG